MPQQRLGPVQQISIHALREEGDREAETYGGKLTEFLSTPSARRATDKLYCSECGCLIFLSTPSVRRATVTSLPTGAVSVNFYPRPPRGGRPGRGGGRDQRGGISIHALREEGDVRGSPLIASATISSARRATTGLPK